MWRMLIFLSFSVGFRFRVPARKQYAPRVECHPDYKCVRRGVRDGLINYPRFDRIACAQPTERPPQSNGNE